ALLGCGEIQRHIQYASLARSRSRPNLPPFGQHPASVRPEPSEYLLNSNRKRTPSRHRLLDRNLPRTAFHPEAKSVHIAVPHEKVVPDRSASGDRDRCETPPLRITTIDGKPLPTHEKIEPPFRRQQGHPSSHSVPLSSHSLLMVRPLPCISL